jgi:xylulokinase
MLVRSVVEGVTFGMRDALGIMRDMGVPVDQIRASGGGARSPFWRQLQADVYGADVVTTNAAEGPAYGVALLAGVGTGVWKSVEEACRATIEVTERRKPQKKLAAVYDKSYAVYRELYRDLRARFAQMVEIAGG